MDQKADKGRCYAAALARPDLVALADATVWTGSIPYLAMDAPGWRLQKQRRTIVTIAAHDLQSHAEADAPSNHVAAHQAACQAASAAAERWLANARPTYGVQSAHPVSSAPGGMVGAMFDLCGNAYLTVSRRTPYGKAIGTRLTASSFAPETRFRQEHGLKVAVIDAAADALARHGVAATKHDYVD